MSNKGDHIVWSLFDWFISLGNFSLSFTMTLHGLAAHSFVSVNTAAVSTCAAVCLASHLLRTLWLLLVFVDMNQVVVNVNV